MSKNSSQLREYIQDFRFEDLFIEELGWDQYRDQIEVMTDEGRTTASAIAEKRGMVVFHVTTIPEHKFRRKIEQQIAKTHRENIIIYTDSKQAQQVWQWVRREAGKPLANRERQFYKGQSGENIAQVLAAIAFSLDEEDELTIVDVTSRVRASFDVDRVTRRFYDHFKREHDAFMKFIQNIPDEDFQRWYASIMLNRLMFIYFVQKKGFLGGDVHYLRSHLERSQGNYYREFLLPLFFSGFATKPEQRPSDVRKLLGEVPYLNGGLFMPHQIEERYGETISIDDQAFVNLFEFFEGYNWHLDERPLRDDNEINPDVLGYIFEKYINQKQMGAYYTKEDITEYISKNTVIPFLFDEARKAVKIAFEGEHTVWDLMTENPDRYIYPAVRYGVFSDDGRMQDLLDEIAAGINDVSKRTLWNTPTPPEYGLPKEIWRETVARRERYQTLTALPLNGDITSINDLITYNYDIQQFAQDVIDYTDSPDVIRAFWKALNSVTVLDPTCGSGAFLFAALNILEPLYEACLERMEGFVADLERTGGGHPQKYSDFREVLERIKQHPNRRYFILKSIIVNNLFGVDIMEEAVEICKLRLFLKLVAQVGEHGRIEPLPDIDFNIRAGNTLVGFATQDEVKRAMTITSGGQGKLLFGEDQEALAEIERKAADVDRLFGLFRQQQTTLGGDVTPEDKQALREKLRTLDDELNRLMAGQYGIDPTKDAQYAHWLNSHKPFHWFVEFYGVLKNGGFDVIIGNPPYVEYSKVRKSYTIQHYKTESSGNLYAFIIEQSSHLLAKGGMFGMIVPMSIVSTARVSSVRDLLLDQMKQLYVSNYSGDAHPSVLFSGVKMRLSIVIAQRKMHQDPNERLYTTNFLRWYSEAREHLFTGNLAYVEISRQALHNNLIPKIGTPLELKIMGKLFAQGKRISDFVLDNGKESIYAHRIVAHFVKCFDFIPHFWNEQDGVKRSEDYKVFSFDDVGKAVSTSAIINSTTFYHYYLLYSDAYHCGRELILTFPANLSQITAQLKNELEAQNRELMNDIQSRSKRRKIQYRTGWIEYDEFYPRLSKHIIDEIDRVLARHYGFTDEEVDFIINYDIKYRMGDYLGGDGDEGE